MVQLESPNHGVVTLRLAPSPDEMPLVQYITIPCLEETNVVHGFLDVFPDDLPGMLLARDVEFTIELQPGMAPISRQKCN
jgi:hypothetical protein